MADEGGVDDPRLPVSHDRRWDVDNPRLPVSHDRRGWCGLASSTSVP